MQVALLVLNAIKDSTFALKIFAAVSSRIQLAMVTITSNMDEN